MKDETHKKVLELLSAIPDLNELTSNPSIFSDDIYLHDCDMCRYSKRSMGDIYDYSVCEDCWERAIQTAFDK